MLQKPYFSSADRRPPYDTEPVGGVVFADRAKAWLKGFRRQLDSYHEGEQGITVSFEDMQKLSEAAGEDGLHVDARSTAAPDV